MIHFICMHICVVVGLCENSGLPAMTEKPKYFGVLSIHNTPLLAAARVTRITSHPPQCETVFLRLAMYSQREQT